MAKESSQCLYANPEWADLTVENPHFNMLHTYDFVVKNIQNESAIKTHLQRQIESAFAEKFLGTGRYDLELIPQQDEQAVFTNPSFPNQGLEETAQRTVIERQLKKLPYEREKKEAVLAHKLTQFCEHQPIRSKCIWTSPPGNEKDYSAQMSISYLGEIQPSTTSSNGKKLHVELIVHKLSLLGHQQLLETIDDQSHTSLHQDTDFVGELIVVHENSRVQSIDQLEKVIANLESSGNIDPKAKPIEYVKDTVLSDASLQITNVCQFLERIIKETYVAKELQLSQIDINDLEKAYSLGYRSVVNHFKNKKLVSSQEIYQDIVGAQKIRETISHHHQHEITPAIAWAANMYMKKMNNRYGDLSEMEVGGVGCPGGILAGFSISINGVEYDISNTGEATLSCVECPFCHNIVDAIVTSTHIICPDCRESAQR